MGAGQTHRVPVVLGCLGDVWGQLSFLLPSWARTFVGDGERIEQLV